MAATLLLVALATMALAPPAAAAAKSRCAKEVIEDWYDNNRVDRKVYPLHCYREAIRILPVDIKEYSGAEDDIRRALLYAQQGKSDPGDTGNGTDNGNGNGNGNGDPRPDPGPDPDPDPGPDPTPPVVDTSGPSAVPVPLIVLAGIAGLLLILGAAGYVTRRAAARRAGDPPAEL